MKPKQSVVQEIILKQVYCGKKQGESVMQEKKSFKLSAYI